MANRRMFNIALISADEFFELENSAKILYFYLALTADDDGFINGLNRIQRSLGCSDADLEALVGIGYIIKFPSGKAVIRHWRVHNYGIVKKCAVREHPKSEIGRYQAA